MVQSEEEVGNVVAQTQKSNRNRNNNHDRNTLLIHMIHYRSMKDSLISFPFVGMGVHFLQYITKKKQSILYYYI